MAVSVNVKKKCSVCHLTKFKTEFYKRKDRPSGVMSHCKECEKDRRDSRKEYHKQASVKSYQKNKKKVNQRSKVVGDVKMQKIDELKKAPCTDCKNTFPTECMEFDHRDPSTKSFTMSRARWKRWEEIEAEIAKCDLVCANCHRIRTKANGHYNIGNKKRARK